MNTQIIKVYYDQNALPYKDKERTVHFPITGSTFVGSSDTTKIRFYVDGYLADENALWISVSKRADGTQGSQFLTTGTDENGDKYREMTLSGWYTSKKGDLYISLKGYQGGSTGYWDDETGMYVVQGVPVIRATGSIKLAINYAPVGEYPYYQDEMATFQDVVAQLGGKLNITSGIVIIVDATEPSSIYEEGQIAYATTQKRLYRLVSGSWVDYFDAYTKTQTNGLIQDTKDYVANNYVGLTGNQTIYGVKSFVNDVGILSTLWVDGDNGSGEIILTGSDITTRSKSKFVKVGSTTNQYVSYKLPHDYADVGEATYVLATEEDVASSIASAISSVKSNAFKVVDSLPLTGEEGIVYLVAIVGGTGYHQYIWEGNQYLNIGDTNIDLSGYVQTSRKVAGYALSSDVTASQIQSALFNVSVVSVTERD